MSDSGIVEGEDGVVRCAWGDSSAEYRQYHDGEWGRPVHGDTALFERITLEAFQSGLSWITILRKRPGFRAAFADFDPVAVAGFDDRTREALMGDAGIVRHRRKIEAAVVNAQAVVRLQESDGVGALDRLVWSFAPARQRRPRTGAEVPSATTESQELSRALKAHGFVFVGPTTMYAAMQACGLVDDHVRGCHRAGS
jgi:DNA-3-methyladenine glycosylase I